ncbi:hypothetical protein PQQ72_30010 [Paraburkholderia strydomiana]|uniref:hypothetical protein n=1 Tax=Paraburkholderia strydomiana TaxID=1245417 RepID=UPI0038B6D9E7
MIKRLVTAAVLCASAAVTAPVFASSGYGPAPHYNPLVGAPSSQRGQSEQTVRAEQAESMASADDATQSYGGMPDTTSQAGSRAMSGVSIAPYSHH